MARPRVTAGRAQRKNVAETNFNIGEQLSFGDSMGDMLAIRRFAAALDRFARDSYQRMSLQREELQREAEALTGYKQSEIA